MAGARLQVTRAASSKLLDAQALAGRIPLCEAVTAQQVVNDCDLVFVTTPDKAIASTVAALRWWAGQGVKGFKEVGRSRYIADAEFDQVKACAHFTVIDAMDLALLTGQRPADVPKLKRTDIRDGALWIVQNKTGARLGIEVTGELAAVIARINERPRRAISAWLVQDENGQPLTSFALRSRFDKARTLAKVEFQFRDIRAKAATDTGDLAHSQKLLAHKNREMTEHYVKARMGERVKPLR